MAGADAPSLYEENKIACYSQTSASGATPDPRWPYGYAVVAQSYGVWFGPYIGDNGPGIPYDKANNDYEYNQGYSSKTELDLSVPDDTYWLTGSNIIPDAGYITLGFPLSPDSYPAAVPSVAGTSNASWSGGVLMMDPTRSTTLDFSDFTTYATAGVGGYVQFQVEDQLQGGGPLNLTTVSSSNPLGIPQQSFPFESYSIPAGTLNSGDVYKAELTFGTMLNLNTTKVPGSGVVSMFQNVLTFYIVTPPASSTTQAPVLAGDILDQFAYFASGDGSPPVVFSPLVTVGGKPISGTYAAIWYLNGQPIEIDGIKYVTNGTSLTINYITGMDIGVYFARFINLGGQVTTSEATLTAEEASQPTFTTQPMGQTLAQGSTVVLTAAVTGSPNYVFVWKRNGIPLDDSPNGTTSDIISGSSGPQLVIANATAASSGSYTLVATNIEGSSTSNAAELTVVSSSNPGSLVNISSRAFVGTGDSILIGGFYIAGSTSRTVLIQALGPALSGEGVTGVLQHPSLSIHNSSGATIYSNTGWGSSQLLLKAAAAAYANPVLQPDSSDSEVLLTLPPGGYTAEVSGAGGDTGVALCAIYQLP